MSKKQATQPGTVALVKVDPDGEGCNDIQNYLESFNKEIENGGEPRDSTYFVDANGQFYYSQRVVCVAPGKNQSLFTYSSNKNEFQEKGKRM